MKTCSVGPRRALGVMAALSAIASVPLLAACGGGNDEDTASASGSVVSTGSITHAALNACPSSTQTPVDMKALGCLVGTFTGKLIDPQTQQYLSNTCAVEMTAGGMVSLSVDGQVRAQWRLSTRPAQVVQAGSTGSAYGRQGTGGFALTSQSDQDRSNFLLTAMGPGVTSSPWVLSFHYTPAGATAHNSPSTLVCGGTVKA